MIISNITPPQVWSASSRNLTDIGSGALANTSTAFTSIAGAASVDLRPAGTTVAQNTIAVITNAAATGSIVIQLSDGTNTLTVVATAAAASAGASVSTTATNTVWPRLLNNDATHAGSYMEAQFTWSI